MQSSGLTFRTEWTNHFQFLNPVLIWWSNLVVIWVYVADNIRQHNESRNTLATSTRGDEFWSIWFDWQVSQKTYEVLKNFTIIHVPTRSSYVLPTNCHFNSSSNHIRLLMENPVQRLGATGAGEVLLFLGLLISPFRKNSLILCTRH